MTAARLFFAKGLSSSTHHRSQTGQGNDWRRDAISHTTVTTTNRAMAPNRRDIVVPFYSSPLFDAKLARAAWAMEATVRSVIPLLLQYFERRHTASALEPLLALQLMQQRAMFALVTMRASLTMCSQEG